MLQSLYFPDQVTKLREFAKAKLIDPLLESPLKPQTKSKPFPIMYSRRHRHGPTPIIHPVQPSTVRLIYRKNDRRPRKDPFDDLLSQHGNKTTMSDQKSLRE